MLADPVKMYEGNYLGNRAVYALHNTGMPHIHFTNRIDGEQACRAFCSRYEAMVNSSYAYRWFNHDERTFAFGRTLVLLRNGWVAEFDKEYCELLHAGDDEAMVQEMMTFVNSFKQKERRQPLEINLIVKGSYGLELKAMEIKPTRLDLDLYYNDDFKAVDTVIRKRLSKTNDKGIVLLHGLPGTGKTTYLRHLVGRIKKRLLFLSPALASNILNPEFIDLLTDNPNSVVIIEDAENIIMDRKVNNSSAVSNLLNISDGLLADFLNVQLVCTFNSELTLIDSALLRKGRLIARYHFGKLEVAKAQRLSSHLGFDTKVDKQMTLAEVANQQEAEQLEQRVQVLGFRREPVMAN